MIGIPAGMTEIAMHSTVPIVVADATREDMPLILANTAFCKMTGRTEDEVLGRNCRFMQPQGGAGPATARIRAFLEDPGVEDGNFILPNERKDGSRFLNLLYLVKIRDDEQTRLVLGSQFDISAESMDQLRAYGNALQADLDAMNTALQTAGFRAMSQDTDLDETLAYVETYRRMLD